MVGGISIGGLGSGLDTGAIINALLGVERVPINALEDRKSDVQKRISLIGTFESHVRSLRDSASKMREMGSLLAFGVTAEFEGIANFSASGGAAAGSHSIDVQQLASVDRWAFDPVVDPDVPLAVGAGESISFTYDGIDFAIDVQPGSSSLNEILVQVKDATDGAVSASVVNTGTASNPSHQLVLAASETGEDKRLENLSSTITGLTIDGTGPDPAGNPLSANNIVVGNNAVALIDGLTVERSSNEFNDVIEGVSITAIAVDATTFTVSTDKEAIKSHVQDFVDAYNRVIDFVNGQNSYSEEEGAGGELFGDSILSSITRTIRSVLFDQSATAVAGDPLGYGTLRLLGIESQSGGRLTIDDEVFDEKLEGNLTAFADLFIDTDGFDNGGAVSGDPAFWVDQTADTGLLDDLVRALDPVINGYQDVAAGSSIKGVFSSRTESLQSRIKSFDRQIEDRERRLDNYERLLVARFSALESTMAQLQAQQQYLISTTQ